MAEDPRVDRMGISLKARFERAVECLVSRALVFDENKDHKEADNILEDGLKYIRAGELVILTAMNVVAQHKLETERKQDGAEIS